MADDHGLTTWRRTGELHGLPGVIPRAALLPAVNASEQGFQGSNIDVTRLPEPVDRRSRWLVFDFPGRSSSWLLLEGVDPSRRRDRDHLALLFLDLDDFKIVNDRHGHHAGDEVLRQVALRIQRNMRPEDACARLGGDEFAVLLREVTRSDAEAVGARLVHQISSPIVLGDDRVTVGASIGLVLASATTSTEQLLRQADAAMYLAKNAGRNRVQTLELPTGPTDPR